MNQSRKDAHRDASSGVAIAAETTLDAPIAEPTSTAKGKDQVPLIMGALEKLASATDQMVQQLGDRLDEVRVELGESLKNASTGDLRKVLAEGFDAVTEQNERNVGLQIGRVADRLDARIQELEKKIEESAGAAGPGDDHLVDEVIARVRDLIDAQSEIHRRENESLQQQLESKWSEEFSAFTDKMNRDEGAGGEHFEALRAIVEQKFDAISSEIGSVQEKFGAALDAISDKVSALESGFAAVREGVREDVTASIEASRDALQAAIDGVRDASAENADAQANRWNEKFDALRDEVAKGQRNAVADLAEGMGLGQVSLEKRFDAMENTLEDWREEIGKRIETWSNEQSARMAAVEKESHEVAELGRKLERNHGEVLALVEQEKERAERAEADREREQARRLNNSGVARYHSGDYQQARQLFEQAVEHDREFAEAFNNLGLCLTELDEHDDATVAFEAAIELNPELGASYNNLGYVLYLQENYEAAIEMYKEAIGRKHDTSSAYTNLGNAHQKLGETEKAVEAWRRALEVDPTNERAQLYLDRFTGGVAPAAADADDAADAPGESVDVAAAPESDD